MIKEKIKNGFAVALSALVCAGVVGSVAFAFISSKKNNASDNSEQAKLSASYVQRIYVPETYTAGEDWKVRMNESAFKFGQNGYVVFGADGENPPYEWNTVVSDPLDLPVYSNLYTQSFSYKAAEEKIYVSNLWASSSYYIYKYWTRIKS